MNLEVSLFNKKILNSRLNNYQFTNIQHLEEKLSIIQKWNTTLETSHAKRTKETSLQGDYLNDFFVRILDYKRRYGVDRWNISQEVTTNVDNKFADAALGYFSNETSDVRCVIELKDARTNLDKKQIGRRDQFTPVEQAFSYARRFGKNCKWIVVSNFIETRLYHFSDMSRYEVFYTAQLEDPDEFKRFYYLLNYAHLINDQGKSIIEQLYEIIVQNEKTISKEFYKDYSQTRLELFKHIKENNLLVDDLLVFEKTQKLLDRFLFVRFCEDRSLLPPNIFRDVLTHARSSLKLNNDRIWNELKALFDSIDKGNPPMNVNRFNGGLFKQDDLFDQLIIKDEIFIYLENLYNYSFDTDLDINILGHIFEQSISDIEEIKASLRGEENDKNKGKRKKDGIFYTPAYITNYIVKKAIGTWLEEKRKLLGEDNLPLIMAEGEWYQQRLLELGEENLSEEQKLKLLDTDKGNRTRAINRQIKFYETYRDRFLKNIKVLDPACGSGAFLNQAFDFLYTEGQKVNKIIADLKGGQTASFDLDKQILKNNLYGVDLNKESVEITKLSLWIKTANNNSVLTSLDKNIKSGNSLIDDSEIVGEDAFDWDKEFPEIMAQGGFDVIIGNPPWGAKLNKASKDFLKSNYNYAVEGKVDSYKYFYEKAIEITNSEAFVAMITPNTFLYNIQSYGIRQAILKYFTILEGIELRKNIFEDAPDVVPAILLLKKGIDSQNYKLTTKVAYHNQPVDNLFVNEWMVDQELPIKLFTGNPQLKLNLRFDLQFDSINKKISKHAPLEKNFDLKQGTKPYGDKQKKDVELIKTDNNEPGWDKAINGRNIGRYSINFENEYVFREGNLYSCLPDNILAGEKIYFQRMRKISLFPRIVATFDDGTYHGLYTCSVIYSKKENKSLLIKYILAVLNSKLINVWYKNFDTDVEIKLESVKKIPIVKASKKDQESIIELVDELLTLNNDTISSVNKFIRFLMEEYGLQTITKRIRNFYEADFKTFVKALAQEGVNLSVKERYDLIDIFDLERIEIKSKIKEIIRLNALLDLRICELYGLTKEEFEYILNN